MSDADAERAAKAARAKAMLKKRQQQKAGPGGSPASAVARVGIASPTVSNAPSEVPDDRSEAGGDAPAPAPPPPTLSTPPPRNVRSPVQSPPATDDSAELRNLVRSQQQTINLLVSEKSSLAASLDRLNGVEAESQENKEALARAREEIEHLISRSEAAEDKLRKLGQQLDSAKAQHEQDYERLREQDRELETSKRTINELRSQHAQLQRRLQELEEQIQADDRVENLERSLKGAQDRADSLESHLSKLRQTHAQVKSERDAFESELKASTAGEGEWKNRFSALEKEHSAAKAELAATSSDRDALGTARDSLQTQLSTSHKSLEQVQRRLSDAASELAAQNRQLQTAQAELAAATRRADDAERTQHSLQTENVALVAQLEEMRPKIVELTGAKLELGESVEAMQRKLRAQDDQIAQLDHRARELAAQLQVAGGQHAALEAAREADRQSVQAERDDMQRAHAELQKELASAHVSIRELDAERAAHRQAVVRNQDEVARLGADAQQRAVEASTAQSELEEQRRAREEMHGLLKGAQTDVEALRTELAARDDEIERLRQDLAAGGAGCGAGEDAAQTLDSEMLQALRQQHALDLSEAHATVRALETQAFDSQAEAHRLQKRITALEDELAHAKLAVHQRAALPPSRPSSAMGSGARSPPAGVTVPAVRPAIVLDDHLTPETRHKRRVSLSMLKARMDSEIGLGHMHSSPLRRNLSNLSALTEAQAEGDEPPPPEEQDAYVHVTRRPQFLDDSHVFWCSACRGDLVVL